MSRKIAWDSSSKEQRGELLRQLLDEYLYVGETESLGLNVIRGKDSAVKAIVNMVSR